MISRQKNIEGAVQLPQPQNFYSGKAVEVFVNEDF